MDDVGEPLFAMCSILGLLWLAFSAFLGTCVVALVGLCGGSAYLVSLAWHAGAVP